MRNLNWNNRFLAATIGLIVVFAMVVGWIIIRENANTTEAARTSSTLVPVSVQQRAVMPPYNNSPARAPVTAKQMYAHIQSAPQTAQPAVSTADNSQAEHQGFEWASQHKTLSREDCNQLGIDYQQGCRSYLEVNHYVNQTDPDIVAPVN